MQAITHARPKTPQGLRQQARASIQQILNEPFEIMSNATEQVTGTQSVQPQNQPQQQPQPSPEEVKKKQQRESRHIQAFQEELREIQQIQRRREQERAQLRSQEEAEKKRKEDARKQEESRGVLEPVGRVKRGILGAVKGMLKRKQTQVEIAKTPSN